jgi:hypothetical protein
MAEQSPSRYEGGAHFNRCTGCPSGEFPLEDGADTVTFCAAALVASSRRQYPGNRPPERLVEDAVEAVLVAHGGEISVGLAELLPNAVETTLAGVACGHLAAGGGCRRLGPAWREEMGRIVGIDPEAQARAS